MTLPLSQSLLVRRLPQKFQEVPAFRDFALALEELLASNVWDPVELMKRLRAPRGLERTFVALTSSMLGLSVDADWLSDRGFERVVESLAAYYRHKGTRDFYRFMGFMTDAQFQLSALWTEDYVTFHSAPGGALAYEGGTWYLTPHVNLLYDETLFDPGDRDLERLFYLMAPIHLVLEAVIATVGITGEMNMTLVGQVIEYF